MAIIRTKQDLLQILEQNQGQLVTLGVRRLGLFGSYVRGEQNPQSDMDLLVEFAPGKKNFDAFINLSFFLEELLGQPVELVTPESLSPYLKPHILKEVEFAALAA